MFEIASGLDQNVMLFVVRRAQGGVTIHRKKEINPSPKRAGGMTESAMARPLSFQKVRGCRGVTQWAGGIFFHDAGH